MELHDYFDSYATVSPAYSCLTAQEKADKKIFFNVKKDDGSPYYTQVTADNYPTLYEALVEEANFRNVPMPDCYVSHGGRQAVASADGASYSITVCPEILERLNKKEMRAMLAHELKHLYQAPPRQEREHIIQDYNLRELDADRAAVTSVGYDVVRSYVDKVIGLQIDQKIQNPFMNAAAQKFHTLFPGFIAENFWLKLDKVHPSPAYRMQEMRKYSQAQANKP